MAIAHVRDSILSGSGAFVAYCPGNLGNEYGVKVFDGNGEIYLNV